MRVIYNGVDLMVLETHEFLWQAVYDDTGTDYLYSRVSIVVTALVNGQVEVVSGTANGPFMSYDYPSQSTPSPTPSAFRVPSGPVPRTDRIVTDNVSTTNSVPQATGVAFGDFNAPLKQIAIRPVPTSLTHNVVRHRLETPRGRLFVFAKGAGMEGGVPPVGGGGPLPLPSVVPDADIFLISPSINSTAPCDAKNGPSPKLLNVTAAFGDANTLVVDWACETFVNEAGANGVSPRGGLLSNRYKQRHMVDGEGYTTVTTEGLALFRTNQTFGTPGTATMDTPDRFRATLFMPIPQGFRRTIDYVEGRPDVSGIAYQYTDVQVPVNFVAGSYAKAADISINHKQSVTSENDSFAALGAVANRIVGAGQTIQSWKLNRAWLNDMKNKGHPPGRPPSDWGKGHI